jgi:hypothetical protein
MPVFSWLVLQTCGPLKRTTKLCQRQLESFCGSEEETKAKVVANFTGTVVIAKDLDRF